MKPRLVSNSSLLPLDIVMIKEEESESSDELSVKINEKPIEHMEEERAAKDLQQWLVQLSTENKKGR